MVRTSARMLTVQLELELDFGIQFGSLVSNAVTEMLLGTEKSELYVTYMEKYACAESLLRKSGTF